VQFTVEAGQPVHVKSVTCSNPRLTAKLENGEAGQRIHGFRHPCGHDPEGIPARSASRPIFLPTAPRAYTIRARVSEHAGARVLANGDLLSLAVIPAIVSGAIQLQWKREEPLRAGRGAHRDSGELGLTRLFGWIARR